MAALPSLGSARHSSSPRHRRPRPTSHRRELPSGWRCRSQCCGAGPRCRAGQPGGGGDRRLEPARHARVPDRRAALLALTGNHAALDTIAFLGLAIFVVVLAGVAAGLSTPRLARWVGDLAARAASWGKRLFRKTPVTWDGEAFVRFRARTNSLLRRRWHVLTLLATLAGHFTVYLVLLVSLRVLDVTADEVTAVEAFAAWSLVRLLGSIPITPGGLGIVELGLTTALVGFGGGQAEVVAQSSSTAS